VDKTILELLELRWESQKKFLKPLYELCSKELYNRLRFGIIHSYRVFYPDDTNYIMWPYTYIMNPPSKIAYSTKLKFLRIK